MLKPRTMYLFRKNRTAAPVTFLPQKSRVSFPMVIVYSYITTAALEGERDPSQSRNAPRTPNTGDRVQLTRHDDRAVGGGPPA